MKTKDFTKENNIDIAEIEQELNNILLSYVGDEPNKNNLENIKAAIMKHINTFDVKQRLTITAKTDPIDPSAIYVTVSPILDKITLSMTINGDGTISYE